MPIFLGLALSELLLYILSERTSSEKAKRAIWYIGCLFMWAIIGFRGYYQGNDTIGYVKMFAEANASSWSEIIHNDFRDPGFMFLAKIISLFGTSPTWFLCATAFLSLVGIWDITWRNSSKPLLTLFFQITLGNFMFCLTGIRQAIAISMCMLAVRFIQERKLLPFLVFVLLGAGCHHSAYLFLPTYFLAIRRINLLSMATNILIVITAAISYKRLLPIINTWLTYDYGMESIDNGRIFYFIILMIVVLGLLLRKWWMKDRNQTIIMNLGIISVIIWTFRLLDRTAERPSMYWLSSIPVVLTNSLHAFGLGENGRSGLLIQNVTIGLAFLYFLHRVSNMSFLFFWQ